MLKLLFTFSAVFFMTSFSFAQPSRYKLGFYVVEQTIAKTNSLKLAVDEKYYTIYKGKYFPLSEVDSTYYYYERNHPILVIQFSDKGKKSLLDYTSRYQNKNIGLIINNELLFVANLVGGPISSGIVAMQSNFTLDKIQFLMKCIEENTKY